LQGAYSEEPEREEYEDRISVGQGNMIAWRFELEVAPTLTEAIE
jgi:hypothetical protein